MRRASTVLLAAALALGAVAAEGEDPTTDPCYDEAAGAVVHPEQRVWFQEGESKVGNAAEAPHPWGTTEPASVQTGAGAGQLSLTSQGTSETQTAFEGTFTGCIDTLLFDVYSFDPANRTSTSASAEPNNHTLSLSIAVDGIDVYSNGELETATTLANEGFGPNLNRFAVDLGDVLAQVQEFLPVPPDGEHTVTVRMAPYYVNTGVAVAYAWDTAETPSGITFNGEVTEEYALAN